MTPSGNPLYSPLPDSFDERVPASSPPDNILKRLLAVRVFWPTWIFFNTLGIILYFIIPRFIGAFKQAGIPMPAMTRFLARISEFVYAYPWVWVISTLVITWFVSRLPRSPKEATWAEGLAILGFLSAIGFIIWGFTYPLRSGCGGM